MPSMLKYSKHLIFIIHLFCLVGISFGQQTVNLTTFKQGETEYILGKTYKTTGKPLVKRSSIAKTKFLKSIDLKSIPNGYQIDHIIPLSQGGEDIPENMQLLTIGQHKIKTAIERGEVAEINHTNIFLTNFNYNSQKPEGIRNKDDWQIQKYTAPEKVDKELSSKKVQFKGPRGGKYYYNPNGKKTYVKSKVSDYLNPKKSSNLYTLPYNNSSSSTSNQPSSVNKGKEIQTGPRGGQYYINSNGNKTYIKKN